MTNAVDIAGLPWRMPLSSNWSERAAQVAAELKGLSAPSDARPDLAVEVHRLATQRLGPLEALKLNRIAKAAWKARERLPEFQPLKVALVGNRTLSFLETDIVTAAPAHQLLIECSAAPYGSLEAMALGDPAEQPGAATDLVFLVVDSEAFQSPTGLLNADDEKAVCDRAVSHLATMVGEFKRKFSAPVVVATIPLPPEAAFGSVDAVMAGTKARFVARLNEAIRDGYAAGEWYLLDLAQLASRVGTERWFDPWRFHQTKVPFAIELGPLVADRFCSLAAALYGRAGRVLVLDLDNTVWGGVIGDDGVEGIRIGNGSPVGEAFLAVQRLALDLRSRGIVLAVCSKNSEEIARAAFDDHPDMLLKLDDFAVFYANWTDKAQNLRDIASDLNLSTNSLVFVDDNPAEREQVRRELPWVRVIEVGDDVSLYPRLILGSGAFEQVKVTSDDLNRASTYSAVAKTTQMLKSPSNYADYLQSLNMRANVRPFDKIGRTRIQQLISKSNQFNLTTRRYSEDDIAEMESDPTVVGWQVRLSDNFGDNGMISVVVLRDEHPELVIDTWLMSCRVLKRGVEDLLMNMVFEHATSHGFERVRGAYIRTPRNDLVSGFFENFGFELDGSSSADAALSYSLEVEAYRKRPSFIELT
ncbi:HAD-IIIC family phosphatase [Labrys neptuniae]